MSTSKEVAQYLATLPESSRVILESLRKIVKKLAPEAIEVMSYGIPTFTLDGINLVHFAAYKNHIGFYPTPEAIAAFKKDLEQYKHAKGSIQFPIDQPMPLDLIRKIVAFRVRRLEKKLLS